MGLTPFAYSASHATPLGLVRSARPSLGAVFLNLFTFLEIVMHLSVPRPLSTLSVLATAGLLAVVLTGCGGGGTSGSSTGASGASSALYTGPISGFGSVIVNGVRFSSVGAALTDDDGSSLRSDDLRLGQTVQVRGDSDEAKQNGTATAVTLVRGQQGAITALNPATNSFTLLGQPVVADANTAFEGVASLAALVVGQTVEVYGVRQADGSLLATRIERKVISGSSLRGVVSQLNATAKTFNIGALVVNYGQASVVGNFANGQVVKVRSASAPVGNVLQASSVKLSDDASTYNAAPAATLKIKGVAEAAPVAGKLRVSGTPVDVSGASYKGGSGIAAGQLVEVKGQWNGTALIAREVESEGYRAAQIGGRNELYGAISSYTAVSSFVVNGVTVDASAARFEAGSATQLTVGAYVEVKGNVAGQVLQATKVEVKSGNQATGGFFEQHGTVSGFVSVSDFRLNGMRVDASLAKFDKGSATGLANGVFIEAKGSQDASGVFRASEVEFQGSSR